MKAPKFIIQAQGMHGSFYLEIEDSQMNIVENKSDATVFQSKMLAFGWVVKAKIQFVNGIRFSVVQV